MKKLIKFYLVFVFILNMITTYDANAQTQAGKKIEFELSQESDRSSAVAGFQKIALWLANLGLVMGLFVVIYRMVTGQQSGYKALLNWIIAALVLNLLIYTIPQMFLDNNIGVTTNEYKISK